MQRIKRLLVVTFVSIFLLSGIQAQSLYVKNKSGVQTSFTLNDLQKLTFSDSNLSITKVGSTTESFDLNGVHYLSFVDYRTGAIIGTDKDLVKQETSDIFLFPNPVKEELTLRFPSNQGETVQVLIVGLDGNVIQRHNSSGQSNSMQISMNVSSLKSGLYLCRLINGKTVTTLKFIKSR